MDNAMTLEEFAKEIGRTEKSIVNNWARLQANLAKKGIIVKRAGAGRTAKYFVEYIPQ